MKMYYKKIFASLVLLLLIVSVNAQSKIEWSRVIGGSGFDYGHSISLTNDDGYIITGASTSSNGDMQFNLGGFDVYISKLDKDGKTLWKKTYGSAGHDYGYLIRQTTDGGFILLGRTDAVAGTILGHLATPAKGGADLWILKLSSVGNIEWQKTIGGTKFDYGFGSGFVSDIKETLDQGFIIASSSTSRDGDLAGNHDSGDNNDAWALRLDKNGNILWSKLYGGTGTERFQGVQIASDGGFVFAGITTSTDFTLAGVKTSASGDGWIVKTDANGNLLWQKCIGGTAGSQAFYGINKTSDGNFVATGYSSSTDGALAGIPFKGQVDLWLLKFSNNGDIIWQNRFGGTKDEMGLSVAEDVDGGLLVYGYTGNISGQTSAGSYYETGGGDGDVTNYKGGAADVWFLKTDSKGALQWQRTLGGTSTEVVVLAQYAVTDILDKNGNYMLIGSTTSKDGDVNSDLAGGDIWVVKLAPCYKVIEKPVISLNDKLFSTSNNYTSYQWIIGTNPVSGANAYTHTATATGAYKVAVADENGCTDTSDFIQYYDCASLLQKPIITVNNNVFTTASSYTTYQWILNDNAIASANSNSYTTVTTGLYKVAVANEFGCKDTSDAVQYFAAPHIFVPNVFTPNGDGKNDILKVFGNQIASVDFQIFNQWGQRIFTTKDASQGWDGRSGGTVQPVGVYMYTLKVNLLDGNVINKKGSVNLIR